MNHYYSLSEKRDFIDADFIQSKLYNMGLLPQDPGERSAYFHNAIENAGEFMLKYRNKGWSENYAHEIVNDWMDNLEKLSKEMDHEADI